MKFLIPNKIDFANINDSVRNWLIETYSQTRGVFTRSSPFGQILEVIQEFAQLIFLYICPHEPRTKKTRPSRGD